MKQTFIIVILFLSFQSECQIKNGYYEHWANDTLVERILIDHDSCFQHYIFCNGRRYLGKGTIKIENNTLNFIYQNTPVSKFYLCRIDFGTKGDSLKAINVKIDKSHFSGDFPMCNNTFINGNKDTILFTDKICFNKRINFKNVQIIIHCGSLNQSVNLGSNFTNAIITLELDNVTNIEILPQTVSFQICSIEKRKFILLDKSNELLIYKRSNKGEREFYKYLNLADEFEIAF
jgi:hypothetical protein